MDRLGLLFSVAFSFFSHPIRRKEYYVRTSSNEQTDGVEDCTVVGEEVGGIITTFIIIIIIIVIIIIIAVIFLEGLLIYYSWPKIFPKI